MIHLLCLGLLALSLQDGADPEGSPKGETNTSVDGSRGPCTGRALPGSCERPGRTKRTVRRCARGLAAAPGDAICDLGCGNGYHTLPLARDVGSAGRVFAVDLQPEMLMLLRERAEDKGLENLEYVEATVDDPRLPEGSCDVVLMVDVYHELSHPVRVLGHIRKALRPGGEVVLVSSAPRTDPSPSSCGTR